MHGQLIMDTHSVANDLPKPNSTSTRTKTYL